MKRAPIQIRDPIHGSIRVSARELDVLEDRVCQRLRGIRQLGFADHAFPGATHTRFAHSLGAMEMATRMFDAIFPLDRCDLDPAVRERFRQTLRLAVLLHDVGHPPLSHASEACMPLRSALGLETIERADAPPLAPQALASHEDYTIKLICESSLGSSINQHFGQDGIAPAHVAWLISRRVAIDEQAFFADGVDYGPLLAQLVSGEIDADRMDYLRRDSYYAGVDYGRFDENWLLENMHCHVIDGVAYLAIGHRAIFAFEDFLLSRYHMFVSVYYHHTAVGYDAMLARFIAADPHSLRLPADLEEYIQLDDVVFWYKLRASKNPWAQRIAQRRPYRRVLELNADQSPVDLTGVVSALTAAGIANFVAQDQGRISMYYQHEHVAEPIYVLDRTLSQATRIDRYSKLFQRYGQAVSLTRIYCDPDHVARAREIVARAVPRQAELALQ